MILGYNTNGFAHHRLDDALAILAELGYRGVALTPDVNHLGLPDEGDESIAALRESLRKHGLACAIETGARFLLDPRRKHQPTLISPTADERDRRLTFLYKCVALAVALDVEIVSLWSGTATDAATFDVTMSCLVESCKPLVEDAANSGVRLAFEPEPGMFIDTMDKFEELHAKVNHPHFGLTLDVGHLVCTGELPIGDVIRKWKKWLWNVHLDDMKPGVHDHLMFGEGTVDFADVFAALREIDFQGIASVELSRHSYDAVNVARKAKEFLDRL
jgi:L-ribulose-5-phosphate 3-epimerase